MLANLWKSGGVADGGWVRACGRLQGGGGVAVLARSLAVDAPPLRAVQLHSRMQIVCFYMLPRRANKQKTMEALTFCNKAEEAPCFRLF